MSVNTKINGQLVKSAGLYNSIIPLGIADIYSTEERQVGCFVDGKPLYQKTYISSSDATLVSGSWVSIFTLSNVDEVVRGEIVRKTADNDFIGVSCNAMVDSSGNVKYQVAQSSLLCKSGSIYTLQYTKTTDTAGSGIWTPSGAQAVHYSTAEQIIGTWINGETLYQKTVACGNGGNNQTIQVAHNVTNIDKYVACWGMFEGNGQPVPTPNGGSDFIRVQFDDTYISVKYGTSWVNYTDLYVTIQYTKSV